MKGVLAKPVCCYCRRIIVKKPIPVGSGDYAHENCIKRNGTRLGYIFNDKGRRQ